MEQKQNIWDIIKHAEMRKIYFYVLLGIGIMTVFYFLKTLAILLGVPLAINEIVKSATQ